MEAGIISRRKVVEATGYDVEEIDRENAADAKRAAEMGLHYRTSPGETQGARATPQTLPETSGSKDSCQACLLPNFPVQLFTQIVELVQYLISNGNPP